MFKIITKKRYDDLIRQIDELDSINESISEHEKKIVEENNELFHRVCSLNRDIMFFSKREYSMC